MISLYELMARMKRSIHITAARESPDGGKGFSECMRK